MGKKTELHLKDLSLSNFEFETIWDRTIHTNEIFVETLYRLDDEIEADILHSKKTMTKILRQRAENRLISILRLGIKLHIKDNSIDVLKTLSPALYDKFYRNVPDRLSTVTENEL